MNLRVIALCALAITHLEAVAEDHAFSARVGMLGVGIEYAYPLGERFAIRGGINGSGYSFDRSESGIDYDFELDWDSISVAVDFHPTSGPLRISGGLMKNDNGLSALSSISNDVTVGGTTYTPAEVGTITAAAGFDGTAPFFGVGWDWSKTKRFGVALDLGIVSQGSPQVSLSADGSLVGNPAFDADLAAEQAELQDALSDLDLIPFATFGVVFRF